ncbi:MAG: YajQ family cyclic di-GMP-binding protein [Spirochaetota bacterium]|nr:YajQ family cyclic di-GMP-binding protein [Spirochaetota bacterium]
MASDFSFDIVSQVDLQEVLNAVNQSNKEISQRYDFKGSKSEVTLNQKDNEIIVLADDDLKLKNVIDVLQSKLVKRNISLKALNYCKVEQATQGMVRQKIEIQSGINKDKCKEIVKFIKDTKIKVQAQIQDSQVRVTGRKKDELQEIITKLKETDFNIHMEFTNYR